MRYIVTNFLVKEGLVPMLKTFLLPMTPRTVGMTLAILSALAFGSLGYFATVLEAEGYSVVASLALRFLAAAAVLWLLRPLLQSQPLSSKVSWRDHAINMALGAVGYGMSAALFFFCMRHTSTAIANILLFQNPVVVALLAWVVGKQRPTRTQLLVLCAVITGLVLVLWPGEVAVDLSGVVAGIASALWYGTYLFVTESRSKRMPPFDLTLDVVTGSALAFLVIAGLRGELVVPHTFRSWVAIGGQSILCTVIPVLALFAAFKKIGARDATIVSALEPLVALTIGIWILGEPWASVQALGACLIVAGIAMLTMPVKG